MTAADPNTPAVPPAKPQPNTKVEHRNVPRSKAFREFIASGWAPRPAGLPAALPAAGFARQRRERISEQFPGERLVIPSGGFKVRSNDTDYRFRAHAAFSHLTGLGRDREPDAVLVLEPLPGGGHEASLFFRPRAERDSAEFYADPRYGELWVGVRQSLAEIEAETGITARHLDELAEVLIKELTTDGAGVRVRVVRDADERATVFLDRARTSGEAEGAPSAQTEEGAQTDAEQDELLTLEERIVAADEELARALSELRLVKDAYEIEQMYEAVAVTVRGFADIVRALPEAVASARGERVIEGVFAHRARVEGNGTGYETIAAAGAHACTLHWIRNDGQVRAGELVLIDAGAETDELYTADVTRTIPVDGVFTEAQRKVYELVLAAADAAFEIARPGTRFGELNDVAQAVIARGLAEWGLLPVDAEQSIDAEGQQHRRWIPHGVSHHLGIDVHDCSKARREMYLDGVIEAGMVFTIEPGLYFRAEDELVPPELRGIGVRIEDDVLVTDDGCVNLSAALPRTPGEIEAWMRDLRG